MLNNKYLYFSVLQGAKTTLAIVRLGYNFLDITSDLVYINRIRTNFRDGIHDRYE